MGSIDWNGFTWDAFATLAAGVMALAAGTGAIIGAIIAFVRSGPLQPSTMTLTPFPDPTRLVNKLKAQIPRWVTAVSPG